MHLSKRLMAIAALVPEGEVLVDVGTDHAYLPLYLAGEGRIPRAIATDLRPGPVERARAHVQAYCLADKVEVRLCDGLLGLRPGEGSVLVLAGMGGPLMEEILLGGRRVWESFSCLVAQPQSEVGHFRRFLAREGWEIREEDFCIEDGKYYPMMAAGPSCSGRLSLSVEQEEAFWEREETLSEAFGPRLLERRDPSLLEFLHKERALCQRVLASLSRGEGERSLQRQREVTHRLELVEEALRQYAL